MNSQTADLLIEHAAQVVTCAGPGPKRGRALGDVGLIMDGAVAIRDQQIVAVGPSEQVHAHWHADQIIDASGRVICPGLVDAHTHVVYAGDRVDEFEQRLHGATYVEIMRAGGGIASTMRATRAASQVDLVNSARKRMDQMLALGTTTVEAKTGYGLDTASELAMLRVIEILDQEHSIDLVPTFLGAHAIPPEYKNNSEAYIDLVIDETLPQVAQWYRDSHFFRQIPLYNDAFCDVGALNLVQTRRVLEAGQTLGLPCKLHADEFESLGGVTLAVEMEAVSVDHLDVTSDIEIERLANSDTIGVLLPAVSLNLGGAHFARMREMADAGVALALATDLNPGSAPCLSMPLVMALACRYGGLVPGEALNASTINAAYAVGLGQQTGSIKVGKQADLLLLDVPDYRHLVYWLGGNPVQTVIKRGQIIYS